MINEIDAAIADFQTLVHNMGEINLDASHAHVALNSLRAIKSLEEFLSKPQKAVTLGRMSKGSLMVEEHNTDHPPVTKGSVIEALLSLTGQNVDMSLVEGLSGDSI